MTADNDSAESSPIVVKDRLDREVKFAETPRRIVSLSPAMTEIIYAIGAADQLVGVTSYCNHPPEAQTKQQIGGGTTESINKEVLLSLEPDLVLAKWDTHEQLIAQLEGWRIPVLALGAESFEGLFEEMELLSQVTGHTESARQFIDSQRQRLIELKNRAADLSTDPPLRVFYQVWDDPLMSAGPDSFIGQLLTMAKTENILAGTSIRYPQVSHETVIAANPDIILAPTSHSMPLAVDSILERDGWGEISAVKNGRVYLVDGDQISRCGPRLVDAFEDLLDVIYGSTTQR